MKYFCLSLFCLLSFLCSAQSTIILAGGGAEGDQGDTSSWSYSLYRQLLLDGDTNDDGVIHLAILSLDLPSNPADANWLPDYFEWLGQDAGLPVIATNYAIGSRSMANNASVVNAIADADCLFLRGGDQGLYYDDWNDTLLEDHIRTVVNRGGSVGGTSAGAMSMAQFAFAGGQDMISDDVLANAQTSYLDDPDGGSGIHNDFLGFVADSVIDTHFVQRNRLGRLAGILARANEDHAKNDIQGIGIEMKTGLVIRNGVAEVIGEGSVTFLQESAATLRIRDVNQPLIYSDLKMDRLTHGWRYLLTSRTADIANRPTGATSLSVALVDRANSSALTIDGSNESDAQKFGHTGSYYPADYARVAGSGDPYIKDSAGFTDAGNSSNRADKNETLFMLLYDEPADVGLMVYSGGTIDRDASSPDVLRFGGLASLVIDVASATYKGLSPFESPWATPGGALRAAAFTDAKLHILSQRSGLDTAYNTRTHLRTSSSGGSGGSSLSEVEPNDSRSQAQDLSGQAGAWSLSGHINTSGDTDYFEIQVSAGQSIDIDLSVPAGVDYDLYLLNQRGQTLTRSINDGLGVSEHLTYTNTRNRAYTYYIEVVPYTGFDGVNAYLLTFQ